MHRAARLIAAGLSCVLVLAAASPALGIDGGQPIIADDARFDAVGGLTLHAWIQDNNCFGNATLIAPDRVLLARHLVNRDFRNRRSADRPAQDFVVRFRRRPDGAVGDPSDVSSFFHARIASWVTPTTRGATDDFVIGILETPVTHIQPVALDYRATVPRRGRVATVVSWGPDETGTKGRPLAGEMRLTSLTRTRAAWTTLPPANGRPAVRPILHDSGAPLLVLDGGRVRMVGLVATPQWGPGVGQLNNARYWPRRGR